MMKTGFKDLDKIIDMKKGDLIVLGGRAAMGKSTLALNIISNVAIKQNEAVLYFNLESSKEQIAERFIISNSMVKYLKYRKSQDYKIVGEELTDEDWDRISYGKELLKTSKIFIDDTANISIDEISKKARKMKLEQDIKFLVIDYLQLIKYEGDKCLSRDLQIKEIFKKLKILAKELNIPILVVSQLSRKPDKRKNHRPNLYDFAESKLGIVSHTDTVLLLYRDYYYDTSTTRKNIAEIIIAKNPLGTISTIEIACMPEYLKFGNLEKEKYIDEKNKNNSDKKIYNMAEEEKINYLRYNTDAFKEINEEDVKQIESDFNNYIYVLLNNGDVYKDGEKISYNIDKLYMFDGLHLYQITKDNKIIPLRENDDWNYWDNIDKYLNNDNCSYKKIVTSTLHIIALTEEGQVKAINGIPAGLGIIPEHFKDVEDIMIVNENEDIETPYILQNKEYKTLYIQ